jgi:transcriptional regulator with XRE-family HTH domain
MSEMSAEIIPLGTRLRQRREQLGLTQTQAARELAVARTAYRLWEMEAARPSPDRWRAIAQWLGLSVTAMLRAAELIDEQDLLNAEQASIAAGLTAESWDQRSDAAEGDFFSQERSMIADQARAGGISNEQAAGLRRMLARLQDSAANSAPARWHPGEFRRRYPCTDLAPTLARAAMVTTAVGLPEQVLGDACLLISELATNTVRHTRCEWVDISISLTTDRVRVAVSDNDSQSIRPRSATYDGGWGLTLLTELATRWGIEHRHPGKTIWFELDLDQVLPVSAKP